MIRRLGNSLFLPKLEMLNRGLFAVSFENVKAFLSESKYLLDNPLRFAECLNPSLFKAFEEEASEESIEFFSMLTPWLNYAQIDTLNRYKLADVMISFANKTQNIVKYVEYCFQYILNVELNFLQFRHDADFTTANISEKFVLQIKIESETRDRLLRFLLYVEKDEETSKIYEVLIGTFKCLSFGPINPCRLELLMHLEKTCHLAVEKLKDNKPRAEFFIDAAYSLRLLFQTRFSENNTTPAALAQATHSHANFFMILTRVLRPKNDYNELLFILATLETGAGPCLLNSDYIPSEIIKDAVSGKFGSEMAKLCRLIVKNRNLDYENWEFVTQNLVKMKEEYQKFKLKEVIKNLEYAKKNFNWE